MKQKYVIWGLAGAAFLVTLGITSWQQGLWSAGGSGAQHEGTAVSQSIDKPSPIPKDPFKSMSPAAAPPQTQTAEAPPQPQPLPQTSVDTASVPTTEDGQSTPPDPINEQSSDDYKQREKLMEELAARSQSRSQ